MLKRLFKVSNMKTPILGSSQLLRMCKISAIRRNLSTFDVVISGGGMVGNAMALACGKSPMLKKRGVKVLLLEAGGKTSSAGDGPYSNRVSAINPSSRGLFEGAWEQIESKRFQPVKQLRVYESCSEANIHFERDNFNKDVAFIVENNLIVKSLGDQLDLCDNVEIKYKTSAKHYQLPEYSADLVQIELSNGETIETRLLIGADGANSLVRDSMGVDYESWEYGQSGVVATLKVSHADRSDIAWQRFTPEGPIALLPLAIDTVSLVWSTSTEEATRLCQCPDEQFVDELNKNLWDNNDQISGVNAVLDVAERIHNAIFPSIAAVKQLPPTVVSLQPKSRAAFPLGLGHSVSYVKPRVALIGDAAHRIHPLAGQGVNLGFGDVLFLSKVLEKAARDGADLGSLTYLTEYETARLRHNVPVMVTMDWLNRLYRNKFPPVVLLRSLGLSTVNRLQFLKDFTVNQASF